MCCTLLMKCLAAGKQTSALFFEHKDNFFDNSQVKIVVFEVFDFVYNMLLIMDLMDMETIC